MTNASESSHDRRRLDDMAQGRVPDTTVLESRERQGRVVFSEKAPFKQPHVTDIQASVLK